MPLKCNLEKINIENLFATATSIPHTNGNLDINTLFPPKSNKDFVVDPKLLLYGGIKRKKALEDAYIQNYKICWNTILHADKSGITDIIFEISEPINCIGFSCSECLNIIEKNLLSVSNNGIKCKPLNDKRLFITWYDIASSIKLKDSK